jgi:hypothetical protein
MPSVAIITQQDEIPFDELTSAIAATLVLQEDSKRGVRVTPHFILRLAAASSSIDRRRIPEVHELPIPGETDRVRVDLAREISL